MPPYAGARRGRWKHKGGTADLKKAIWYINRLIKGAGADAEKKRRLKRFREPYGSPKFDGLPHAPGPSDPTSANAIKVALVSSACDQIEQEVQNAARSRLLKTRKKVRNWKN